MKEEGEGDFFSTQQCEKQINFFYFILLFSKHTRARSVVDKKAIERYGEMARRV